jgi:hypothetical protein
MADGIPTCLFADLPGRFIPFEGRCVGGCSCRASAFSGLAEIFQRLYITGAYLLAITEPSYAFFIFNGLRISQYGKLLDYGTSNAMKLPKTIEAPPYRWHCGQ